MRSESAGMRLRDFGLWWGMASFDLIAHSSPEAAVGISTTPAYSAPIVLPSQVASLGVLLSVLVATSGTASVTLQTAAAGVTASDSSSWLDTPSVWTVPLSAVDTHRERVASYLLDQVRVKVVGVLPGAGATLYVQYLTDVEF